MTGRSETVREMRVLMAAFVLIAVCGAFFGAGSWWGTNRMQIHCLLADIISGGNSRAYDVAQGEKAGEDFFSFKRTIALTRYHKNSGCTEYNEEKLWENMRYLAEEREWAEAQFLLAKRLSYGKYGGLNDATNRYPVDIGETYFVPNLYYDELDTEQAYYYLKASAAQGLPVAQGALAHLYWKGNWGNLRVRRDRDESARWLREYEEHNPAVAFYVMGERYLKGSPGMLEADYGKAIEYLEMSVRESESVFAAAAMVRLSLIYECVDEKRDMARAREWRARARDEYAEYYGDWPFEVFYEWKDCVFQDGVAVDGCRLLLR